MTRASIAEARLLASGRLYQEVLQGVIAPLSAAQLGLRLVPGRRTIGEIAERLAYRRALWLPHALGAAVAAVAPLLRWDAPDDLPHRAAEVVSALDRTGGHIGFQHQPLPLVSMRSSTSRVYGPSALASTLAIWPRVVLAPQRK